MQKIHNHSTLKLLSPKYLLTWPGFALIWMVGQLPHKFAIGLGNILGRIMLPCFSKRAYIIRANLHACFPELTDKELKDLTQQNFNNLIVGALETAIAWYGKERAMDKLESKFCIENEAILQEYLNKSEPLLLVAPHCMSQELVSKYLVKKYQYIPVFRHLKNPIANFLMQKARLKIYEKAILKSNTREIINAIKQQKIPVGILPDQDFGRRRSVFVPFFNVIAATSTALSKYKKLTNCNVVALSYRRQFNEITKEFERFVIQIHPPLNITGTDLEHDARELNIVLEKIIQADITAYFWITKKFKTRPQGEPAFYHYPKRSWFSIKKHNSSIQEEA